MSERKPLSHFLLSLLAALLLLACAGTMFLPLVTVSGAYGEALPIPGFPIMFGGELEMETSGGFYAFSFELNVILIIVMQGYILAAVSCFLGRQNRFNRIASLVLCLASIGASAFMVPLVCLFSSLSGAGVALGIGTILALCMGGCAFLIESALLVLRLKSR